MKKFMWKYQPSLCQHNAFVYRLYINNKPTWFTVTDELKNDLKTMYALDLYTEVACCLQDNQRLGNIESHHAVDELWKVL